MMPSAPAFSLALYSSIAWAVSFEPPPVMIFARPAATSLPASTSRIFSASVSVDVSPVVPVTTMPSAPAVMTSSMCFSTAGQSTSPSAVIGVTSATRTCPKGLPECVMSSGYRDAAPRAAAQHRPGEARSAPALADASGESRRHQPRQPDEQLVAQRRHGHRPAPGRVAERFAHDVAGVEPQRIRDALLARREPHALV